MARLHDRYQGLPENEWDKGLIGFAACPPLDDSFLTANLWDKYLPKWREPRTEMAEVSPDLLDAIQQMGKEAIGAAKTKVHDEHDVDKLDFVTVSKKVSLKKGSYFRFSKESTAQIIEDEARKAAEREAEGPTFHARGTAFSSLSERLAEACGDPKSSNVEVYLLRGKKDGKGQRVIEDGKWKAEVQPFAIRVFDQESEAALKQEFDRLPVLSILILWTRYGTGKLGIVRFKPTSESATLEDDLYEHWERVVISAYVDMHKL